MQQSTSILQSAHSFSVGGNINVEVYYPLVEETSNAAEVSKVAQWLSNPKVNYWSFHNEIKARRTAGTGLWFLEGDLFLQWTKGELKALWMTGIPGSGKTVLASSSIEHTRMSSTEMGPSNSPVVYVYCRYVDRCTARDVLCSFLEQLVISYPAVYTLLRPSYDTHRARQTKLSESEAVQGLADALSLFNESFGIVDGLDEVADEEKVKLLTILSDLPIKLLIFSRPLELFVELLPSATFLPLLTSDEDIGRFVADRISTHPRLRRLVSQKEPLVGQIVETIKHKSDGMFLLAALQVDALNGCLNMKSLMKALGSLPSGIHEMYRRTLSRISDQSEEEVTLAMLTLLWLTYAQRSLKIEELQDALATSFRDRSYDADAVTESDFILSTCCGLVTVDNSSHEVRLIHHTTHEYLQSLAASTYPFSDHAIITALTCTTYLAHHGYPDQDLQTPEALQTFLSSGHSFIRYTQQFWALHARQLTQKDHSNACAEVVGFLNRCQPVVYAFPLLNYFNFPYRFNAEYEVISPCHIAARFGLVELFSYVKERDRLTARYSWNALHAAALFNQGDLARVILGDAGVDINDVDARGRSALHLAAQEGSSTVVKLLLSQPGIKVNLPDSYGSVPLCLAAEEGHHDVVALLAQHPSININARTRLGESPLLQSAQNGKTAITEVFLDHPSIDVNVTDGRESFLLTAVRRKEVEFVKKIIAKPRLDTKWRPGLRGHTALFEAVVPLIGTGVNPTLALLLKHPSLDVNERDSAGHTPLTRAMQLDNMDAVELLLAHPKIDPNARDPDGFSPLHCAMDCGGVELCQAILAHSRTDPNSRRPDGYTPLVIAIMRKMEAVFDMLLQHPRIEVRRPVAANRIGNTALAYALESESRQFIQALLDHLGIVNANGENRIELTCRLYGLNVPSASGVKVIQDLSFRYVFGEGFIATELDNSALAIITTALQAGTAEDLEEIANLYRDALQPALLNKKTRISTLLSAAKSFICLYTKTQSTGVLEEAITSLQEARNLCPSTLPMGPSAMLESCHRLLAEALFKR
ncbi:hypothetical protein NMY22_g10290 [Coprinellus aureogranulatus]|nr:hypothetical protein NMY22_g10290 [Coprinellus aureogranulatus]